MELLASKAGQQFKCAYISYCSNIVSNFSFVIIFQEVPWDLVGFPEQGFNETTLWIGSRGAHTPCHSDTYGYNLVAQVIGR